MGDSSISWSGTPNCDATIRGVDRVVGHRLAALILGPEGDRVRVDGRIGSLGEHRDDARVEATAEECRDRRVAHHVRDHGVLYDRDEVVRRARRGLRGHLGHVPVRGDARRAVHPPFGPRPRRQLLDAPERAPLLRHVVIEDRRDERAGFDLELGSERGGDGFQLRREHDSPAASEEVERLDPELVAGQDERAATFVEDREREHAPEVFEAARTPAAPRLEHDLGVGCRREARAARRELGTQLPVVVELAIVGQDQSVLAERLVGRGRQIDDGQPAVAQVHVDEIVDVVVPPVRVRAAVCEPPTHRFDDSPPVAALERPYDAAHISGSPPAVTLRSAPAVPTSSRPIRRSNTPT